MSSLQQPPKYHFYATLLDAFSWYRRSQSETAFQELIDRINRVPFDSEAANKGTAFNDAVDNVKAGRIEANAGGFYEQSGFFFDKDLVDEFAMELQFGIEQVRISETIPTCYGDVELYGVMDELMPFLEVVDIKTTGSYTAPKYLHNWQHVVYPYILFKKTNCLFGFTYYITDFKATYKETYQYNHTKDVIKLSAFCEEFIEFLEQHRSLITDERIITPHYSILIASQAEGVTMINKG